MIPLSYRKLVRGLYTQTISQNKNFIYAMFMILKPAVDLFTVLLKSYIHQGHEHTKTI